jgi:hypothetical protein
MGQLSVIGHPIVGLTVREQNHPVRSHRVSGLSQGDVLDCPKPALEEVCAAVHLEAADRPDGGGPLRLIHGSGVEEKLGGVVEGDQGKAIPRLQRPSDRQGSPPSGLNLVANHAAGNIGGDGKASNSSVRALWAGSVRPCPSQCSGASKPLTGGGGIKEKGALGWAAVGLASG